MRWYSSSKEEREDVELEEELSDVELREVTVLVELLKEEFCSSSERKGRC